MTWLIFFNKHAAPINHDISNKRNKGNFRLKQSSPPGGTWWEFWFFYLKIRIRASLTERSRSWLANQSHVTATLLKSEANGWSTVTWRVTREKCWARSGGGGWGWCSWCFARVSFFRGTEGGAKKKKRKKKATSSGAEGGPIRCEMDMWTSAPIPDAELMMWFNYAQDWLTVPLMLLLTFKQFYAN